MNLWSPGWTGPPPRHFLTNLTVQEKDAREFRPHRTTTKMTLNDILKQHPELANLPILIGFAENPFDIGPIHEIATSTCGGQPVLLIGRAEWGVSLDTEDEPNRLDVNSSGKEPWDE